MLNAIWFGLVVGSILWAGLTGRMDALQEAMLEGAKSAVALVIGLVGVMAFFLGLMRVAEDGGLLLRISRALAPLLRRLFPEVPADHPAMGAMIMNLASNLLGLGNAATPFGLKAMAELERLNPRPGVASDAMVLFLAINATSISLLPLGTIAVRAGAGSHEPAAILVPTFLATTASTLTAVALHFVLRRRPGYRPETVAAVEGSALAATVTETEVPSQDELTDATRGPASSRARLVAATTAGVFAVALVRHFWSSDETFGATLKEVLSSWLLPGVVVTLLLVGIAGGVKVYESAIAGAKEALDVSVRIVPFLVLILAAVAMFRASGLLELMVRAADPVTSAIGFPAEALPMAILRPLSGSGAFGVMSEILKSQGPDSFAGLLVSTLQGSTETTFYVLAVYFGAAGIRQGRHALACCLAGDLAGFAMATAACHLFFSA